jgi:hypothetical protein
MFFRLLMFMMIILSVPIWSEIDFVLIVILVPLFAVVAVE